MKSYEEMTNAVLFRAKEEKAAQKHRRRKALAAVFCVCFTGLAVFAGVVAARQPDMEENRKTRISLFSLAMMCTSFTKLYKYIVYSIFQGLSIEAA